MSRATNLLPFYGSITCYKFPFISTSTLVAGEWLISGPVRCISGQIAPGTLWKRGWVDPRFGLKILGKRNPLTLWGPHQDSSVPCIHTLTCTHRQMPVTAPFPVIHKINFFQRTPVVYLCVVSINRTA